MWPSKSTWLEHALLEYVTAMDDAVQSAGDEFVEDEDDIGKSTKCFSL